MTPAEEIEKLSAQVKRQRAGHKKTNKELKEEKARYSVLASEYNLVLEELKSLKNSRPLAHIGRIDKLTDKLGQEFEQNRSIKKTILKTHIPENLHGFLEELSGDSSYE